MAALDI